MFIRGGVHSGRRGHIVLQFRDAGDECQYLLQRMLSSLRRGWVGGVVRLIRQGE